MLNAKIVINEGLQLTPEDRCKVIDALAQSIDTPGQEIDELWRKEIESRVAAYEAGTMETVPFEEVMAKYRTK